MICFDRVNADRIFNSDRTNILRKDARIGLETTPPAHQPRIVFEAPPDDGCLPMCGFETFYVHILRGLSISSYPYFFTDVQREPRSISAEIFSGAIQSKKSKGAEQGQMGDFRFRCEIQR
jgi:hypothetical protein